MVDWLFCLLVKSANNLPLLLCSISSNGQCLGSGNVLIHGQQLSAHGTISHEVATCRNPEVTNQHHPFSHTLMTCNMGSAILVDIALRVY